MLNFLDSCSKFLLFIVDICIVCCNLHSTGAIALTNSPFAEGSLPIHVDSLTCRGNETVLLGCPYNNVEVRSCGRFEDASVICQGIPYFISIVP